MEMRDSNGWANVDATGDSRRYIDYLDRATVHETAQAYKPRTYELVGAAAGRRLLDLGCGTGDDATAMARQVGPGGEVVGVDLSKAMVEEARRRAGGLGLPLRFEVADALALPFADQSFDGCRADRVFQHLGDPEGALAELVRVARPGAPVVVTDPDFGSAMLDVNDRALARRVQAFVSELVANPWSGRRLPGLFRVAGLTEIQLNLSFWPFDLDALNASFHLSEALPVMQGRGLISAAEAEAFLAELAARQAEGRFFGGVTFFVVAGRKAS